jgi:Carboxypeptidase regulatory-like domain/TonB dependent receptor/TonB-dependent Receptor Plug Domain
MNRGSLLMRKLRVMEKFRWIRPLVFFLASCFGIRISAQVSTATIAGVVQDSSKASIPGASIRLINTQTGAENDATTSHDGGFVLPGVIPGAYTLQIERQGFATTQLTGLLLNEGDTKNLLIRMKVSSIAESVIVDASGLILNTADASVSTAVDQHLVANVPLNGRSFQDLISLTPGIVTQSPQAASGGTSTVGEFSVNGQQPDSNAFFVDGVSANINAGLTSGNSRVSSAGSIGGTTAIGTTQNLVSVDALQEFRVLTSSYSAEYGRTPGGQFTFITRSGTNKFHGSAYTYFRDTVLNTEDWFRNYGVPQEWNQFDFGGTLGGPVILPQMHRHPDQTFVFLSYEGLYLDQPTPQTYQFVPSYQLEQQVPLPLQPTLQTFPAGDRQEIVDANGVPTGLAYSIFPDYSLRSHVNATSVRFDHIFNPRFSLFFRYADTPSFGQSRQLLSLTKNQVDSQTFTWGATSQLSASLSNEFRLGYTQNYSTLSTQTAPLGGFYEHPPNLIAALGIPALGNFVRAQAYIHVTGAGDTASNTDLEAGSLHQWNVRDTFSVHAGNHLFRFGLDQRQISSTLSPAGLSVQADFFQRQSLVYNLASALVVKQNNSASPVLNQFSAFLQDEWKLSKRLNVSLGVRSEVNPAPTGKHGADAFTASGNVESPSTLRVEPRGTPLWQTSWFSLAPRLGAAWIIDGQPGRELVLRAGGGIFFDTGGAPALRAFSGLGFSASQSFTDVPLPATLAQLKFPTPVAPTYNNTNVFAFPAHLQLPYSVQWDIGLEKALGRDQSFTLSYVGAEGRRLLQEQRRNVGAQNPAFSDVSYFPGGITSSYEAMQIKFQRLLARGVEGLASYSWAHALDYGSTDPFYPLVYGTSDLDVRQNLEAAASWTLPKARGNFLVRKLVGNWAVDGRLIARTGFPVNLAGNFFFDPITGNPYYSGVDLIPNRPLYLRGPAYPGNRAFNGGPNSTNPAFSLPDGTAQGNAPRNLLRGFSAIQTNIAGHRDFAIREHLHMQIQGEVFNLLNHPNFGYIDPYLTDSTFGQATRMLNQSFGGTGSLYQQGGPRSTQFSVRLVF